MQSRNVIRVAAAWLPFHAVWVLFILTWSEDATLGMALRAATISIGSAAILGAGVWSFTGRYGWPDRLKIQFYLGNVATGLAYAVVWVGFGYVMNWFREGGDLWAMIRNSRVIGWQLLMGLWVYGLIAGVSYALRIRTRLEQQHIVSARAEALAREAQLRTLRAQLDPHFLFNALHSLSALLRDYPERAERAIEQLGDLLRYSLAERDRDVVELGEELEFTKRYLDLERLRLEDRLQVVIAASSEAKACWVPSFTLQPLVENAIKHNFDRSGVRLNIDISATLEGDLLSLTVRDDGTASGDPTGRGTGLANLARRLDAWPASGATLDVRYDGEPGCIVRILLPQFA